MKSEATLPLVLVCFFLLLIFPSAAPAQEAQIALHADQVVSKTQCTTDSPVARGIPCMDYTVQWPTHTGSYVYLVVADVPVDLGVQSLTCGINYCATPGVGADVFGWFLCGDAEFTFPGPHGAWPSAGSANIISWDECQETEVPPNRVHAVAGVFYVYAYDDDQFRVTKGDVGLVDLVPSVTHCNSYVTDVPWCWISAVDFTEAGLSGGYNPCAHWDFPPEYHLSPWSLDFEDVVFGEFRDRQIDFEACHDEEIDITIEGDGFSIVSGGGPQSLLDGQVASVVVRFEPLGQGEHTGTLYIGARDASAALTGFGDTSVGVEPSSWGRIKRLYQN